MNEQHALLARTLDWIVRIPLNGEAEIARLVGVGESVARRLILALVQLRWVESLEPTSTELEARRRYVVRTDAVAALTLAVGAGTLAQDLPIRLRDVLHRVTQFEITVGVGRLLADLAEHVRRAGVVELADGRSLPLATTARDRWWLTGTNGYGCLRMGERWAPFLVAWDRAAAPDEHRRRRVRAWIEGRTTAARPWGAEGLPSLLLVCPGEREEAVWEKALLTASERDPFAVPSVLLTTREALVVGGVGGAIWRRPGDTQPRVLLGTLGWGARPSIAAPWLSDRSGSLPVLSHRQGEFLRAWAGTELRRRPNGPIWRRTGAVAVLLGPVERAIVEWIARFLLPSAADLAPVLNEPVPLVERRLEGLVRCDMIRRYRYPGAAGSDDEQLPDHGTRADRYFLGRGGEQLLADRAGVPVALFREHAGIKPRKRGPDGEPLFVRHVEHTIGVNRAVAQLARNARARGGRLVEMRSDAESAWSFIHGSDRYWIRPDGSGILRAGGLLTPFMLEYDRGTLDGGDFTTKFEGYRRFYASHAWRERYNREPLLLFVCADTRAARRVSNAAKAASLALPMQITTDLRLTEGERGSEVFGRPVLPDPATAEQQT